MSGAIPQVLLPPASGVVHGIEELIGNTPMLRLPVDNPAPAWP
jgi:hypothetical protein